MKNKKLTYLLLLLVAIVWGLIFYRIFFGISKNKDMPINRNLISTTKEISVSDSFSIQNNYADPFGSMGVAIARNKDSDGSVHKQNKINDRQERVIPPPINWPSVMYKGKIINTKNNQTALLLNVNGMEFLSGVGKKVGDVVIISTNGDSILLKYNESLRYFKKQR